MMVRCEVIVGDVTMGGGYGEGDIILRGGYVAADGLRAARGAVQLVHGHRHVRVKSTRLDAAAPCAAGGRESPALSAPRGPRR